MAIHERKMTVYECDRCEHEWIPRDPDLPKVCPKCKSPYWNTPRKNPAAKTPAKRGAKKSSRAKKI